MTVSPWLAGSLTSAIVASSPSQPALDSLTDAKWHSEFRIAAVPAEQSQVMTRRAAARQNFAEPEWLSYLTNSARRIGALRAGWDGPGSIPMSERALLLATSHTRLALKDLQDVAAPELVPGGDGSVQIEWHSKHGELELDIDPQGKMFAWIRDHRNDAEFDGEGEAALALFYRWAPWVASQQHDDSDASLSPQVPFFAVAA